METIDLSTLGGIVVIENNGHMMSTSWIGEAITIWGKLDQVNVPIGLMRQHLTEAYKYNEQEKPEGCLKMTCLLRTQPQLTA